MGVGVVVSDRQDYPVVNCVQRSIDVDPRSTKVGRRLRRETASELEQALASVWRLGHNRIGTLVGIGL